MTQEQKKEVVRVCGKDHKPEDVPSLWRQEEIEKEIEAEDKLRYQ